MKHPLLKGLLTAALLAAVLPSASAGDWKLKSTTPYGTGGRWENGEKTRVDCSYRAGVFSYERKVSSGTSMSVYTTKATCSVPKQTYASGEDIGIRVSFTESGNRQGYSPYVRVTVLSANPGWSKGGGRRIPASGAVDGQAVDAAGRFRVLPPETVTLMAEAPKSGSEMAIVLSCNGMDILYLYEQEGVEAQPATAPEPVAPAEPPVAQPEEPEVPEMPEEPVPYEYPEAEDNPAPAADEPEFTVDEPEAWEEDDLEADAKPGFLAKVQDKWTELTENSDLPVKKIAIVGGIALALILLILLLFRGKKEKAPAARKAPVAPKPQAPAASRPQTPVTPRPQAPVAPKPQAEAPRPKVRFCPGCGSPVSEGQRFCEKCGHKLN